MKKTLAKVLQEALVGKKITLDSITDLTSDKGIVVEITDTQFDEKGGDDDDKFIYYKLPDGTITHENLSWDDVIEFVG